MKGPLVSIIIPTYRRDDELNRAISSAYKQTYDDCEIILIDDNDDLMWNEKVESIVQNFPNANILYIQNHPNQGSAKSRNIGIEHASGEYITFLDDDDVYLPEKVEKQLTQMMEECSDYSLSDLDLYNEDGTLSEKRRRTYLKSEGDDLLRCHLKYHMTGTDTMMFRKEYLLQIECFEPIDVGDEYYLMMKAIRAGGKLSYLPASYVKAYVHTGEGGLSSGAGKIQGENNLFEYKKTFFSQLGWKDIHYIRMRHHAVLAFAHKREGNRKGFLVECARSFAASPVGCLRLLASLK